MVQGRNILRRSDYGLDLDTGQRYDKPLYIVNGCFPAFVSKNRLCRQMLYMTTGATS